MKFIPYATQSIDEADIQAVSSALRSSFLTQGPLVDKFEKKVAAYCGAKYAVALNSGTSALHAACFAAGIKPGDEVITSPITFVASANCVLYCGGKPVFADIQADTVNLDPKQVAKKINKRTKAIIPVHFAGHPADMEELQTIAKSHNLTVIEDAAHALGATYKGSKIGSCKYSDMTILSFHAVKHITTGEGGMVLTNNRDFYEKLLMFRTHGITRNKEKMRNNNEGPWRYEMQFLGYNYRLTDFQSALGIRQLGKLEKFIRNRKRIVKIYNEAFKNIDGLTIASERDYVDSSWHLYVIRVEKNRKNLFELLRKEGIGVNVHYLPVYLQPYYLDLGYAKGLCEKAEKYYEGAITLPLYPVMEKGQINRVIRTIKKYFRAKGGRDEDTIN